MIAKIVEITAPIFVVALVGFFYSRAFKPDLAGANKMVVDVALPILIFISLSGKDFNPRAALWFTVAAAALIVLSGVLALPLRKLAGMRWRALLPCVMFTNVGPVGIPLIVLAYGPEGLGVAIVLLVISNILHFTLGSAIMSGRVDWRMVFANPLVYATVLGIVFAEAHWRLPEWLATSMDMIGNVLVPMMLLALGARLSTSKVSDARIGLVTSSIAIAVRLCATLLLLQVVPLQAVERGALILFACLPPAVFNFMLADRFQCEPHKVASIVLVGHLASVVFLPLGIWLALR